MLGTGDSTICLYSTCANGTAGWFTNLNGNICISKRHYSIINSTMLYLPFIPKEDGNANCQNIYLKCQLKQYNQKLIWVSFNLHNIYIHCMWSLINLLLILTKKVYEAVSEWVTERVLREDKTHSTGLTMSDLDILVPKEQWQL